MGDYILLDSPMIENAVKITANVKNAPRRFGRSSLKDTPVVSGASDEYNGYFKIIMKERSENGEIVFEVVDGHNPGSEFCGYTDIRGAEEVRKFQITLEANEETEIYFHACGTPGNYTTVISLLKDNIEGSFDSVLIGRIERSGYIRQILQTDEPLPYKKDWYL